MSAILGGCCDALKEQGIHHYGLSVGDQPEAGDLAREGAIVVVSDILQKEGQTVVEEIRAEGGDAVFVKADILRRAKNPNCYGRR